jgi:hypothetical protein
VPRKRINYRRKISQTSGTYAGAASDNRIMHNLSVRSHRATA